MTSRERIRQVRQTLGLTQSVFAERIGISKSHLSSIERGEREAIDRTLQSINNIFNVNKEWLRTGEGSMYDETGDVNIAKANSLFKLLTSSHQECALIQLKALVELQNANEKCK